MAVTVETWAERIPAAIAKGEELVGGTELYLWTDMEGRSTVLAAGEVALAKALWESWGDGRGEFEPPAALRAFVEKVEALCLDAPPAPAVG